MHTHSRQNKLGELHHTSSVHKVSEIFFFQFLIQPNLIIVFFFSNFWLVTRSKRHLIDENFIVKVYRRSNLDALLLLRANPIVNRRRIIGILKTPARGRCSRVFNSARTVRFAPLPVRSPASPVPPSSPTTPSSNPPGSILARHVYASPSPSTSNATPTTTPTGVFARMMVQAPAVPANGTNAPVSSQPIKN